MYLQIFPDIKHFKTYYTTKQFKYKKKLFNIIIKKYLHIMF